MDITWNGVSSSTVDGLVFTNPVRQLLGGHRGSFLEVPGRRGSWYYPEWRGRRTITVPGFVLVDTFPTERRDALTALADWLDVDIEAHLILGDEPSYYYEAVLGDCGDLTEWRQTGQFELQWLVSPFAFAISTTTIVLSATNLYTTTFDPDLLTSVDPVIEITPTNGTLLGFSMTTNGEALNWQGNVISGNSVTVNGISAVVTTGVNTDLELTGTYDSALLAMGYIFGAFPSLRPGANTFSFERTLGTATTFTITIHYRKAYRK